MDEDYPSASMITEREEGEITSMDIEEPEEGEIQDMTDDDRNSDIVPVAELATDKIFQGLSSVSDPQEFISKFQDENKLSSSYDKTKHITIITFTPIIHSFTFTIHIQFSSYFLFLLYI